MRRLKRVATVTLVGLAALAALASAAWWLAMPQAAAWYAAEQLRAAGIPVRALRVERLGFGGADVADISLGDDAITIGDLVLSFSPARLWSEARADRIVLENVHVHASVGPSGIELPGFAFGDGAGPTALPALPVDEIVLRDSIVTLTTPMGTVEAPADLRLVTSPDGGIALTGTLEPRHALGQATLDLDVKASAAGEIEGRVRLRDTAVAVAGLAIDHLVGEATFGGTPASVDRVEAELTAAGAAWAGVSLADIRIDGEATDRAARLRIAAASADGGATARLSVEADGFAPDSVVTIAAAVDAPRLESLARDDPRLPPLSGAARLSLDLAAPMRAWRSTAEAEAVPGDMEAEGSLDLELVDLSYGDELHGLDAAVQADVAVAGGQVWLTGTAPWRLAADHAGGEAVALTLDGSAGAAQRLLLDAAVDHLGGGYVGGVDGRIGSRGARGDVTATATLDPEGGLAFAVTDATMAVDGVDVGGLTVSAPRLTLSGQGTVQAFTGHVAGELDVAGTLAGVALDDGAMTVDAEVGRLDGVWTIRPDGCLSGTASGDVLALDGDARLCLRMMDGASIRMTEDRVTADGATLTLDAPPSGISGLPVSRATLDLAGLWEAGELQADLRLDAALDGTGPGGVSIEGGRLRLAGLATAADGSYSLVLNGCLGVEATALAIDDIRTDAPLSVCARPSEAGLTVTGGAGGLAVAGGALVDSLVAPVTVTGPDGAGMRATITVPQIRLTGVAGGNPGLDIAVEDAEIAIADPAITFGAVDAAVAVRPAADEPAEARLSIGTVSGAGFPLVPLTAACTVTLRDGRLAMSGAASGAGGALALRLEGGHDLATGRGEIRATLPPTVLPPVPEDGGGGGLAEFMPAVAPLPVVLAAGTIAGEAVYGWGGTAKSATLRVHDAQIVAPAVRLAGVEADLTATSFFPLHLPMGQRATVRRVDAGLTLEDGELLFGLDDDRLQVGSMLVYWSGGRLTAGPFETHLSDPAGSVVLDARRIDLGQMLGLFSVDELMATGRMSGQVPVRLQDDTIFVNNATLRSEVPGVIRYAPAEDPAAAAADQGGGLELLMESLRDFRYESLVMTLNGQTGKDMEVGLRIEGANPAVYDGYPIALNVNVGGALDTILRRSLETARYDERLEEYLQAPPEGVSLEDYISGQAAEPDGGTDGE